MSLTQMSLSGAAMIFCIVVIRALAVHKLPKRAFMVMWGAALARLLVPFSLPSVFSVYTLAGRLVPARPTVEYIPAVEHSPAVGTAAMLPGLHMTAPAASPAVTPAGARIDPWTFVWLVGALACALFFAAAYFRCRREFKASLPVDNAYARQWLSGHPIGRTVEIRQSDKISAPLTYGVFRPVILMPKTTDWEDRDTLRYVLAHEAVHIRRLDAVTKLLLVAAACVHWFNPAVWIMYALANRDIELSCDEAVVRQLGEGTRSAYAMALIRMEETRNGLTPLYNGFSKNAIEERIIAIMRSKKTSVASVFVTAVLVVCMVMAFATTGLAAGVSSAGSGETEISYTFSDVEWWTAEEYAAWLENEKEALQSVIGSWAWTSGDGWFVWTQERVDEAIERYEKTLKDIQSGIKISKPVAEGDTMVMFGFSDAAIETDVKDYVFATDEASDLELLLEEYKEFGLTYDIAATGEINMKWQGNPVHSVYDTEKGIWTANSLRGLYLGPAAVDLETVYEHGILIGLRERED